jgi:rhodanese-related sulfurtransferase
MQTEKVIGREELKRKVDRGDSFKLVMALPEWAFRAKHIHGSIDASSQADLLSKVKLDDEIVVYCSTKDCISSAMAYQILVNHGYTNVRHFPGGLLEWEDAGYPLEGEMTQSSARKGV